MTKDCTCLPEPDGWNDACPEHGVDAMVDRVKAAVGKTMTIEDGGVGKIRGYIEETDEKGFAMVGVAEISPEEEPTGFYLLWEDLVEARLEDSNS